MTVAVDRALVAGVVLALVAGCPGVSETQPRPVPPPEETPTPPPDPGPAPSVERPARPTCERLRLAILGLEARVDEWGSITPEATHVGRGVTTYLRREAREDRCYELVPGGDKELIDEKLMNACMTDEPRCIALIGENMHVDHLIFGAVTPRSRLYKIDLSLIDVRSQIVQSWTRSITHADADQQAVARAGYDALARRIR